MIIHNVEGYKLYQYDNGKLRTLNRELKIGESAFLENSDNKIKRVGKDEYMFQRFDTISTHIKGKVSDYNLDDIKKNIIKKLDYKLKYADDRVVLADQLLKSNQWIYDLASTTRFIQKEVKKKDSFLSENQPYDKLMEIISSYINHAKFKNKQDEQEYYKKVEELKKKQSKNNLTDIGSLDKLITEIQSYHHKIIKSKLKEDKRLEVVSDLGVREVKGDFLRTEEEKNRQKRLKKGYKKAKIDENYWDLMGYSEESKQFRVSLLEQMEQELAKLHKYIGLDIKDMKTRIEYQNKLMNQLQDKWHDGLPKTFTGERQFNIIVDMHNQLKGDYEVAKKLLTDEINLKKITKGSTDYDINSDTWYETDGGDIVELSKNHVLLSDANTYKGLILTYKDLKDKYYDDMNHDIWSLLFVFEELLNKTEFTQDEQFVLDMLFDNFNQKQIREKYELVNLSTLTTYRVSNLINTIIPNKLANTYINSVEEWVYTEKIKGNYKKCSKCEEIKLANERYYGKDGRNRDGYKSICKKCDNYTK